MAEKEKSKASIDTNPTKIVRATIGQLTIYEISEAELITLEKGTPGSIYLNFAIFLLSIAAAFTIAIAETTTASPRIFAAFFITCLVGYIFGVFFLALWIRCLITTPKVSKEIRKRLRSEGISENIPGIMGIEISSREQLEILEATYGLPKAFCYVTENLKGMIKENQLRVIASNAIAGDPAPGQVKILKIRYKLCNNCYEVEFAEGTEVVIPL